jgi:hypothetical protein
MVYCVTKVSDFSMFGFIPICVILSLTCFVSNFHLFEKQICKDSSPPPKYTKTTTNYTRKHCKKIHP